ncbi:ATP-binding cassette domain-containing protein, partial [Brevibacillus sp. LEMMJ03]|uniref:ATP-binding cassette domain-containing protein n=1 Tax=Brevibacillus sp. LEMMJ03 TaxID=2595056 RepID=UPI001180AA4A
MPIVEHAASTPTTAPADLLLSVKNIEVIYDHVILVLKGVSLDVPRRGIVALLGANGAGKTTLLEGVSGVIPVAGGKIEIDGHDIHRARPGVRVAAGLAHVEQGRTVFRQLTTDENLR